MKISTSILTVNAGSSSVKIALLGASAADASLQRILEASVNNIGQSACVLSTRKLPETKQTRQVIAADQSAALALLLDWVAQELPHQEIAAIGHRIVHGGPKYGAPQLIDQTLKDDLQKFAAFDPEHAPAALGLVAMLQERLPDTPQVACFDTAFFHDMPRMSQIVSLPRKYEAEGLRRYGFHGLSYSSLLSTLQEKIGDEAARGRIIIAHLGSGASLAAIRSGKPVDTTMGFTPASGVMMSTRSGDLDPGIAWYLHQQHGVSPEEYNHMVNFESGLLGVSELSADMHALLQHEADNEQAAEAVSLFCYQVKKSIGALTATLGGLDVLVFSGGIGEQAPLIRTRICEGLEYLGIKLDETANASQADVISVQHNPVAVRIIPTDEAFVIAKQTLQTLSAHDKGGSP